MMAHNDLRQLLRILLFVKRSNLEKICVLQFPLSDVWLECSWWYFNYHENENSEVEDILFVVSSSSGYFAPNENPIPKSYWKLK